VHIKRDKAEGLAQTLAMIAQAERLGLDVKIGRMVATSPSMPPALQAHVFDLDGNVGTADSRRREFSTASVTKAINRRRSDSI
jgi:hypothetical protein